MFLSEDSSPLEDGVDAPGRDLGQLLADLLQEGDRHLGERNEERRRRRRKRRG